MLWNTDTICVLSRCCDEFVAIKRCVESNLLTFVTRRQQEQQKKSLYLLYCENSLKRNFLLCVKVNGAMESTETRICRFCFSSSNPLIDIFNESETNVLEIIVEHIGEVNPNFHTQSRQCYYNQMMLK